MDLNGWGGWVDWKNCDLRDGHLILRYKLDLTGVPEVQKDTPEEKTLPKRR